MAVFVALGFVMDSFFILYIVVAVYVVATLIRLLRGGSLAGVLAQGTDYRDSYEVQGGLVSVEKDGQSWIEPLANYDDVLWRVETVRRGDQAGGRHRRQSVYQIIELRHGRDRDRDVNIYTSQEVKGMRARWEEAARAFDLPALRDLGDGKLARREPGDLDKSLRDLAVQGRLRHLASKDAPVPAGARWTRDGRYIDIDLRKAVVPYLLIGLPVALFALFVGFMVPADPRNTAVVITVPALIYGLWILISFRIRVTPERLTVGARLGPLPLWHRSLPLDEIEEVLLGQDLLASAAVLIESDSASLHVGPLGDAQARWLTGFLPAAIGFAPT